jgi:hypothetical protein
MPGAAETADGATLSVLQLATANGNSKHYNNF